MKAGETHVLTGGEYADFSILGVVRALRDFDEKEVLRAWMNGETYPSWNQWPEHLVAEGYCEHADVHITDVPEFR